MSIRSKDEPLVPEHVAVKLLQYSSAEGLYLLPVYLNIRNYVRKQCTSTAVHCIQKVSGSRVGSHRLQSQIYVTKPLPSPFKFRQSFLLQSYCYHFRLPEWQLIQKPNKTNVNCSTYHCVTSLTDSITPSAQIFQLVLIRTYLAWG